MLKVSDYIIKRIEEYGIKDVFLISGGGMMHLLDSIGKSKNIKYYCNLNEQATTICADAYSQYTNDLSACMLTTGPGATNGITGVVSAYIDSQPMLVISGQVKTSDIVGDRKVRQIGAQEANIVEMVKSVTKYAATIMKKEDTKYHLDKAIYLATHGRRGPVWIDVPLDIQGAQIDEDELVGFDPENENLVMEYDVTQKQISDAYILLQSAKRPVFLIGNGVISANASEKMRLLAQKLNVPVLATWRAKMVFADNDPIYFGHPGSPGPRYSNYILQNSDVAVIIGTRLNAGVTAFNEKNFAPNAKKIIIDIDQYEIAKLDMNFEDTIICDAGQFIQKMLEENFEKLHTEDWLTYCKKVKGCFPIEKEEQVFPSEHVNMYLFGHQLSEYANEHDVIVEASSGRSCGIMNLSFIRKEGQTIVNPMGLGSMGYAIPAAIGSCVASGKKRTIVLDGDGSLHHNIQELGVIKHYNLPIKLFILNNGGYASIITMQKNHFEGRLVACNSDTGVELNEIKKLAELYGFSYYRIESNSHINSVLSTIMQDHEAVLCEVNADCTFDEIPKAVSKLNDDGTITSSKLEDLFPFLPQNQTEEFMSISKK